MAGLLNIGATGLYAAQANLNVTSHNIVNVGTPGYSRQSALQTTNEPFFSGAGFFGQGTRIESVKRQYSQFLENQVLSADNRRSELSTYNAQISQISNLFADPDAGLSPALAEFFAGVQEVAANPSSVPARQAMLSSAQALAARFQAMDTRLSEIRDGVEGEIGATVDSINAYAKQIAELNQRIVVAQAAGGAAPANDLLDQRNVLVAELNKLTKVNTVPNGDGSINVFVGSGQSLVLGSQVNQFGIVPDQNDPTRSAIALVAPNGNSIRLPESLLGGGALGGLLSFRSESLDLAQDRLNLIARSVAESFNQQHALGVDLDGAFGLDFFRSTITPQAIGSAANPPTVEVGDVSRLTTDQYRLTYTDAVGNFTLTRVSDGQTVLPADVGLDIQAPGTSAAGDSFLIDPFKNAARDFAVTVVDARKIAAAGPVMVEAAATNQGTGGVGDIVVRQVDEADTQPAFAAIALSYDGTAFVPGGGATIERFDTATNTWVAGGAYDAAANASGRSFRVTSGDYQFEFRMTGSPSAGDTFTFGPADAGVADNRNAVALGALQTSKTMFASAGGTPTATFQSAYAQVVTTIGNQAREVQTGEAAQEALLAQATEARDALSGVNLDEEAANLIRYQQAYQAAGRVMSIAQQLFEEVLSIAR